MDLTNKNELLNYLKSHGLWAKHGLGQNFLVDRVVLDKIVEAAELSPHPASPCKGEENCGDLVIEVGPGVGTMTGELTQKAGKVIAVELDEKLSRLLDGYIAKLLEDNNITMQQYNNFKIINADILKVNVPELVGDKKYKIVANIPYYITSRIIELFLTLENKPESMVMLVQKEVAERICAKAGEMSVLAISVQVYGEPEIVDIVPRSSFFPEPDVDSAVLRIKNIHSFNCHPELDSGSRPPDSGSQATVRNDKACNEKDFFRLVHIGFASKRKTLLNNLSAGLHIDKISAASIIEGSGLKTNIRAQELSIKEWTKLAKRIMNHE